MAEPCASALDVSCSESVSGTLCDLDAFTEAHQLLSKSGPVVILSLSLRGSRRVGSRRPSRADADPVLVHLQQDRRIVDPVRMPPGGVKQTV
jgi:hypothetical protein